MAKILLSWMAKENAPCIFISAVDKVNIQELRNSLTALIHSVHAVRYPNYIADIK